jgi:hypothetical protein
MLWTELAPVRLSDITQAGTSPGHPFSAQTSPQTATYVTLWSSYYGHASSIRLSLLQTEAWSGKGLYINNANGYWAPRMPNISALTCGSDENSELWNFSNYVPDAVIINLGVRVLFFLTVYSSHT